MYINLIVIEIVYKLKRDIMVFVFCMDFVIIEYIFYNNLSK